MADRKQKYLCAHCGEAIRKIGKHTLQKHQGESVLATPVSKKAQAS